MDSINSLFPPLLFPMKKTTLSYALQLGSDTTTHCFLFFPDMRLKFTTIFFTLVSSISLSVLGLRFGKAALDDNFVSDISTRYSSSAEFLSLYALLNLYIYTMAFVYSPSKNAHIGKFFATKQNTGVHKSPYRTPNTLSLTENQNAFYLTENQNAFYLTESQYSQCPW